MADEKIMYYSYTEAMDEEKQVLADIVSGLYEDYPEDVIEPNSLQADGSFEMMARLLFPSLIAPIAEFNRTTKVVTFQKNESLSTLGDFEQYLRRSDVIIKPASGLEQYTGPEFWHDILALDADIAPTVTLTDAQLVNYTVAPSDAVLQRQAFAATGQNVPGKYQLHEYMVTSKVAQDIVARFKREASALLFHGKLPETEELKTIFFQFFVIGYRSMLVKRSKMTRPVVYVSHPEDFPYMLGIMNDQNWIEEYTDHFQDVSGKRLFATVLLEMEANNMEAEGYLGISDENQDTNRVRVQFKGKFKHEPEADYELDLMSQQSLI